MFKYMSATQAVVLCTFFGCLLLGWVSWTCYVVPKDHTCHEAVMEGVSDCQVGSDSEGKANCLKAAEGLLGRCADEQTAQ